jgi:sugar phosphate isomerase/epimerase
MDNWTFQRRFQQKEWTVWDYIKRCEELKLDGLHLGRRQIGQEPTTVAGEYAKVRDACEKNGWEVVVGGGNGAFATQDSERCLNEVQRDLEAARLLGTRTIRVFLGGSVSDRRAAIEWSIRNLRAAVALAADHDCVLAVEVPHSAIDFPADALEILERIDSPNLGVTLDTGNLYTHVDPHLPPVKAASLLAPRAAATHVRDSEYDPETGSHYCVPCGEGMVDLPAIAAILKENHYEGSLALEFLELQNGGQGEERDRAIAASVEYLRAL